MTQLEQSCDEQLHESLCTLLDSYFNKDIHRQQTSKLKNLNQELSMVEYSKKMSNDPWLPFLNLTTNERLFLPNKEQLSNSIINAISKLMMHHNPLLYIQLRNLPCELLE